jgi:hypothetical protein
MTTFTARGDEVEGLMNSTLERALEETFKPLGIVAFSRCCRWGCTGSYDEGV